MTLINQAIDTTRDLIACHDSDTRYDDVECRSSVAALYLPIVGLVIGALPQLHGYGSEDNSSMTPDVAMAIATSSITTLMSSDEKSDIASQVIYMHLLCKAFEASDRGSDLRASSLFLGVERTEITGERHAK